MGPWAARNEPPHHAPARRHLERPLTCTQSDEALLIAPKPRTSMPHHHRRCTMSALNVMTTTKVSCSNFDLALPNFSPSPHFHCAAIDHCDIYPNLLAVRDNQTLSALTRPRPWA